MPLGPDDFNCTVRISDIFCFQGDDKDDFPNQNSEPYLLALMVKVDGTSYQQKGNYLTGSAQTFFSAGGQGNLKASIFSGNIKVPENVGKWTTGLKEIPVKIGKTPVTSIPGFIACAVILMEENMTNAKSVASAFTTLRKTIVSTVDDVMTNFGLAGVAADSVYELGAAQAAGKPLKDIREAVGIVIQKRMTPVQSLFPSAAIGVGGVALLANLGVDGIIGTVVDRDDVMGWWFRVFTQPELAGTVSYSPWRPNGTGIPVEAFWDNMPDTAYAMHGTAYAHHKFELGGLALPSAHRIEVKCTSKRPLGSGQKRIGAIGGVENGVPWSIDRPNAAALIVSGKKSFFVKGPGGKTVEVRALKGGSVQGAPWYYLATETDYFDGNNLIELPDCPAIPAVETWY